MSSQLQVRLYRDSFNTPWGFRLQGGKDLGQALSIQRVFSNSPAEGELQRGDLILNISGRDANELTHKQALDLIKHGGGQIQLVIQRPAPGRVSSAITIKPQRPRAPSLQLSPVYPTMPGPGHQQRPHHLNPCYNPNFLTQHSPSSPSHPPPWAVQNFAPKKVSKLSRLGGGGLDFVVDYGSHYGTVPRRRHSTQVSNSMLQMQGTGGNPARVTSLSHLGGGGFDFGTDYCTLPRKSTRQASQPPPHQQAMPAQGGYGFQPKKVTLSNLGGGGPEFGSDFTSFRPSVTQPVHVHTGGRGPQHNVEMLNRVQESLDNISLSPRTPDYGYQAPPFASPTGYIPTAVRLDMEREQEEARKHQQQYQQQQYQQPQYQQQSPNYNYEAPSHQPGYVPTGLRIEQQLGEQEVEVPEVPVWQMRKTFMNAPARPAPAPVGKSSAPKVPRPKGGQGPFSFGVDYNKPAVKSSSVTWKPQPIQRPVNVAPSHPVQSAPPPWQQQQQQQPQQQYHYQDDDKPQAPPAWRNSLKKTGVKPWDVDVDYQYGQAEGPRSVPFTPKIAGAAPAPHNPAPYNPAPAQSAGAENGPNVVHLQYNSPMGLYSKQNVQETYTGQTKAMAAQGVSPGGGGGGGGGGAPPQNPANPAKQGDRDWTQSAIVRMIQEEENRGRPAPQQFQQQQRGAPPPPAPKPQAQFQPTFTPMEDDFGTSDF